MIDALVTAETLLVGIVVVLVVGLLRAYGDLRREVQLLREDPVRKTPPARPDRAQALPISGIYTRSVARSFIVW
jgi:hypothetical protein